MLKSVLASEFFTLWPTIATVFFVFFTCLMFIWILRPGSNRKYLFISESIFEPDEVKKDEIT